MSICHSVLRSFIALASILFLTAACGGGRDNPPPPPGGAGTLALASVPSLDGYAELQSLIGPAVLNTALEPAVGDGNNNALFWGFYTFDTGRLPTGATIRSATLEVYQRTRWGQPYDIMPPRGVRGQKIKLFLIVLSRRSGLGEFFICSRNIAEHQLLFTLLIKPCRGL